jgi:hypothetical protein
MYIQAVTKSLNNFPLIARYCLKLKVYHEQRITKLTCVSSIPNLSSISQLLTAPPHRPTNPHPAKFNPQAPPKIMV